MFIVEKSLNDTIENHTYYEGKEQLINTIQTRFDFFVNKSKVFIIEDYIENEWRDSFDLYYSKTLYSHCNSFVKRVHFISDDIDQVKGITEENYIGYIDLRPIPISQISRVRFKCTNKAFEEFSDDDIYCLSMDTSVNLPHISIKFNSFPIYAQDGMVAICAHADLLMISKYMYKKFNFNNYKLKDIIKNNNFLDTNGRKLPSEGLNILQMLSILSANNYNPIATHFKCAKYGNIDIIDYINSFLESALPVILAFNSHVILIIGHMHNGKRHYVIADDSTYHVTKSFKKTEAHVAIISEDDILKELKQTNVFVIAPTFDRFYFHYQYLKLIIEEYKNWTKKNLEKSDLKDKNTINIKTREILVESCKLKQFLHTCGDDSYESVMMPHYVWYVEGYINEVLESNLTHYFVVDASAHKRDRQYSLICNNKNVVVSFANNSMKNKKQLSRLKKI
ncbi:MAG: hypothetical protein C0626_05035 [Arcobacter sp.]|uniref:hypothetical protein n=1 Tax=uncultured Arcobacter sp. TaxID=165434 RepID=UPI000CB78BEF|nr:hypothetical protein [uncultured Arcobacter sp.]PLY10351.1 MAG: hypothetical protein C0626_05035 [Arcobacter sp.]